MENRPMKKYPNANEEAMIRKREKDYKHAQTWGTAVKNYERYDKINAKMDNWTSPRYYRENNELIAQVKSDREKKEHLEKRREKLRKLFMEEDREYEQELIIKQATDIASKNGNNEKEEEEHVELLKSINNTLKLDKEVKRRHKAEEGLYNQWRNNNPILREYTSKKNIKDVKLSWLDQQIEKRMAKEREEKQARRMIKEREKYMKEQQEKEAEIKAEIQARSDDLKKALERQIAEFHAIEKAAEDLKKQERIQIDRITEIGEIDERRRKEEHLRAEKETVLYNMRQHSRKLEIKSKQIEESLERDRKLIEEIQTAKLIEDLQDEGKKHELKASMDSYLELVQGLKDLEKRRKPHIEFTFESEAKAVYDKFNQAWVREEQMRSNLIREVIEEVRAQIVANAERNKHDQLKMNEEKARMLDEIEKYNDDLHKLKELEEEKKAQFRKDLDEQIKENLRCRKVLEGDERNKAEEELVKLRVEEDRLQKEIMKLQRAKPCYNRRRFFN